MKRFLVLLLLLALTASTLVGCAGGSTPAEDHTGEVYSVTFISGGKVLDLGLHSYISGARYVLPRPADTSFAGWYRNADCIGEAVTAIGTDTFGDLVFYARYESAPDNPIVPRIATEVLGAADGSAVEAEGVVVGVVGNNFYVSDGVSGVYVYVAKTSAGVQVGQHVTVRGTKTTYEGLVEITGPSVTVISSGCSMPAATLTSLRDIAQYSGRNVTVTGTVSALSEAPSAGRDWSLTLTVGGTDITVFFSKHLESDRISPVADVNVGDTLSVRECVVTSHAGTAQLAVTETTAFSSERGDVPPVVGGDLARALSATNYKYVFSYTESGTSEFDFGGTGRVDGDRLAYTYDYDGGSYTDYLSYDPATGIYTLYAETDEGYLTFPDTEEDFYYYMLIDLVSPEALDPDVFSQNADGTWSPASRSLQAQGEAFLGAYEGETYTSMKITVSGTNLVKAVVTSHVEDDEFGDYDPIYTVTFSGIGAQSVTLPDAGGEGGETGGSVADAVAASDGSSVTVRGAVVALVGNNFYVSDGEAGIYVYAGKTSLGFDVGDAVSVTGTKTTFHGLPEIKDVTSSRDLSDVYDASPATLSTLADAASALCRTVVLPALTVTEIDSFALSSKADYGFTVTDGTATMELFFSKQLAASAPAAWGEIIGGLAVGDTLFVEGAVIGTYDGYQILVTSATTFSVTPPTRTGITAERAVYSVPVGTSFADAVKKAVIRYTYSNGSVGAVDGTPSFVCLDYDPATPGTYTVTVTLGDYTATFSLRVTSAVERIGAGTCAPLSDVTKAADITRGLPSLGEPRVLVIPVDFSDYAAPAGMTEKLQTAFFGTAAETGWQSLSSYYYASSGGLCRITGTVLDVFHTGKPSSYYEDLYAQEELTGEYADSAIIRAALQYYDDTVDFSDYDTDGDGYIDALYIVYTTPVDYDGTCDLWWAYTYEYFTDEVEPYDGVEADFYTFFGYEFFDEEMVSGAKPAINCETLIHESGHLFGLTDYYDYDSSKGPDGGIGGGDMMDYNVGDHNAFSKLLLGWVDADVVSADTTVTLGSFGATGHCVIVPKAWEGSAFSEYFIIDYYTPDGLNEAEAGESGLFSVDGVRVYHVDATLADDLSEANIWYLTAFDNTETAHKLLMLEQADGKGGIEKENDYSEDADLWQSGETVSGLKWYDGTAAGFSVAVTIAGGEATLTFSFS